jgi:hypothetical protein
MIVKHQIVSQNLISCANFGDKHSVAATDAPQGVVKTAGQ